MAADLVDDAPVTRHDSRFKGAAKGNADVTIVELEQPHDPSSDC
jgi:hypothetical protein